MFSARHLGPSRVCWHAIAAIFIALFARPALAAEGFFIGDSIGQDVAQTTGQRGVARPSVNLRTNDVINQMGRLPKGAIALMSIGLNNAADPVDWLRPSIERVIAAALATGEKFVWIGPPCVLKKWDKRAEQLDAFLRDRLAATSIQFVSLRDPQICQPKMRSSDGEHFTPNGYLYVWQKIQHDSSFAAAVEINKAIAHARVEDEAQSPAKAPSVASSAAKADPRPRKATRRVHESAPVRASASASDRRVAVKTEVRPRREVRSTPVVKSAPLLKKKTAKPSGVPSPL